MTSYPPCVYGLSGGGSRFPWFPSGGRVGVSAYDTSAWTTERIRSKRAGPEGLFVVVRRPRGHLAAADPRGFLRSAVRLSCFISFPRSGSSRPGWWFRSFRRGTLPPVLRRGLRTVRRRAGDDGLFLPAASSSELYVLFFPLLMASALHGSWRMCSRSWPPYFLLRADDAAGASGAGTGQEVASLVFYRLGALGLPASFWLYVAGDRRAPRRPRGGLEGGGLRCCWIGSRGDSGPQGRAGRRDPRGPRGRPGGTWTRS